MYTTLKPMIPKIIVLILVVLLCDTNTTTCIPSCYFSYCKIKQKHGPRSKTLEEKFPVIFVQNYFSLGSM